MQELISRIKKGNPRMKYDFDTVVNRRNTDSLKWNVAENELPMWVADMDFKTAPEITEAIKAKADIGVYGYTEISKDWYDAYTGWWERRHNFRMEDDWLMFVTGVIPAISSSVRKLTTPAENVVIMTPVYNIFFNSILNNGRNVFGVIALLLGGILGGVYSSRVGLKKSLWVMAGFMTLPCLTFVYLAMAQPSNVVIITIALCIEQFGYGFGFTAYMLYMMYFSEGEYKTSHYAVCTAFMALSMMLPGFVAGYIQEAIGYVWFFWMVMICCFATLIVTYFADRKIDPNYGKKEDENK